MNALFREEYNKLVVTGFSLGFFEDIPDDVASGDHVPVVNGDPLIWIVF